MPITNSISNLSSKSFYSPNGAYIPQWAIRKRLPPEAQLAFDLFSSLTNLGDFMRTVWKYAPNFTSSSRFSIARIGKSCSKIISSFKNELPEAHSIITDLYLSEIQTELDTMTWWMINHQKLATYESINDGGTVIEMTPSSFAALSDIENWQVVEGILYSELYTQPFDTNSKLLQLLSGITFAIKKNY